MSGATAASPTQVWEVLTDIAHAADTLSRVDRVEVLSDAPYGVGTRWRETRIIFGKETTEELLVTVSDAPHRTVVELESGGFRYTTAFTVAPEGSGTVLHMEFTGDVASHRVAHRLFWALFGALAVRTVAKEMRVDLADIVSTATATG